ncbi:tryptophan 2,3-dioxygenase [Actinoalloteichus hymeniacidonis]|uniref:Tryptophan 2,3-dioxygenase n=1 Tax=Actinoalloteichus hymeniacidonis TaxID=340345 RepID=A0AAC9HV72_9PSEU|nr:tryptophan 2,3-dioxygenase family protein [Actinoalloteichus hymeniacidonis]AOS65920.1 tryptophan 2,3-dioxygenase (vermilion) [Actinoalloteichus hymeniacidonis]MBB5905984.1 tryptophan 2,3-dioxygenase [Actinoalloteichus hymeniacidonis]
MEASPDPTTEPHCVFDTSTPYDDYIRADALTRLARPRTDDPAELAFLISSQVMELWFTLLIHEWRTAVRLLAEDDLPGAMTALRRSLPTLSALNAAWQPIARLTPAQFDSYRPALGKGSGFQSARYRELEFLLGEKSANMLKPHEGTPRAHAELTEALLAPSLHDAAVDFVQRKSAPLPQPTRERDRTHSHPADPAIEQLWRRVYNGDDRELIELGEVLTDIAEGFWRWRSDHLMATRRAMGSKPGTGGSAGVTWLERRAARLVFPELWTVRTDG